MLLYSNTSRHHGSVALWQLECKFKIFFIINPSGSSTSNNPMSNMLTNQE